MCTVSADQSCQLVQRGPRTEDAGGALAEQRPHRVRAQLCGFLDEPVGAACAEANAADCELQPRTGPRHLHSRMASRRRQQQISALPKSHWAECTPFWLLDLCSKAIHNQQEDCTLDRELDICFSPLNRPHVAPLRLRQRRLVDCPSPPIARGTAAPRRRTALAHRPAPR